MLGAGETPATDETGHRAPVRVLKRFPGKQPSGAGETTGAVTDGVVPPPLLPPEAPPPELLNAQGRYEG